MGADAMSAPVFSAPQKEEKLEIPRSVGYNGEKCGKGESV
jgi:hypothetical protein